MNSKLMNIIIFVAGVATGSVATYTLLKEGTKNAIYEVENYYLDIINNNESTEDEDENLDFQPKTIDEVLKEIEEDDNANDDDDDEYTEEVRDEYINIIENQVYSNKPNKTVPYIIDPDDFGEIPEYSMIYLTYYQNDGFLVDDHDELVDNVDRIIGWENLNCFGEGSEPDAVYIRNEDYACDFEILRVLGNYR